MKEQLPEIIALLLENLSEDNQFELLQGINVKGESTLMLVIHYQPNAIELLLAGLSEDKKCELLQMADTNGNKLPSLAAQDQPCPIFVARSEKTAGVLKHVEDF